MPRESDNGESGAPVVPAPVGFADLARGAWTLYSGNFRPLVGLYLVLNLGLLLFSVAAAVVISYFDPTIQIRSLIDMLQIAAFALVGSFGAVVTAAFLADRIAGIDSGPWSAWRPLRPFTRDVLTAGFLSAVVAIPVMQFLAGLGLFVIPILFGPPIVGHVVAVERVRVQNAWPRARELAQREWGRIFMYLLTLALGIALVLNIVLYLIGLGISELTIEGPAAETLAGVGFGLALPLLLFALAWPLIAAAQFVMYMDVRARKEKLDLARLTSERVKLQPPIEEDPTPD